ncbi:unnamed protein product, partial [Nesidiocoris tenuis]
MQRTGRGPRGQCTHAFFRLQQVTSRKSKVKEGLPLVYQLGRLAPCRSMLLKFSHVFSAAVVSFSLDGVRYQANPVKFVPVIDKPKETAFNVTIPLHDRLAKFIRIQLYFTARWILLSEVTFES